ncbi:hypothetical protein EKH55_2159 [Sinorhizobium alkalisoli]|nr:hypothetical protein EKH55_2159 [Sinorhizobium alkalisoli]
MFGSMSQASFGPLTRAAPDRIRVTRFSMRSRFRQAEDAPPEGPSGLLD